MVVGSSPIVIAKLENKIILNPNKTRIQMKTQKARHVSLTNVQLNAGQRKGGSAQPRPHNGQGQVGEVRVGHISSGSFEPILVENLKQEIFSTSSNGDMPLRTLS